MRAITRVLLAWAATSLVVGCEREQPAQAPDTSAGPAPATVTATPSPPGARVFLITPVDGATVSSPVIVKFGVSGMSIAPAGDLTESTGHHHLLVDAELADYSAPVPTSDNHLHFGKGQTETTLDLAPGQHTLQLVLGDGNHIPHDPPVVSAPIRITVE